MKSKSVWGILLLIFAVYLIFQMLNGNLTKWINAVSAGSAANTSTSSTTTPAGAAATTTPTQATTLAGALSGGSMLTSDAQQSFAQALTLTPQLNASQQTQMYNSLADNMPVTVSSTGTPSTTTTGVYNPNALHTENLTSIWNMVTGAASAAGTAAQATGSNINSTTNYGGLLTPISSN